MARVELAEELHQDFDRIFDYLVEHAPDHVHARIGEIMAAISLLEHSPLIGKAVARDKRELVIGRRGHGYVVLYRYAEKIDTVFVLAVRSQREAGCAR